MTGANAIVVGAGPAGLAVAGALQRKGRVALLLERGDGIAQKWRDGYDSLRINTSTRFSYLPGLRFPKGSGQWPARDELVAYYESYAARLGLHVCTGTEVLRIDRADGGGWHARTSAGVHSAPAMVVATAKDSVPVIPDWSGRDTFTGRLLHAAEYRNAAPFAGDRVVVVGAGNSGFDIALELAGSQACEVALSVRTPPHVIRRAIGPLPSDLLAVMSRRVPNHIVDAAAHRLRKAARGYVRDRRLGPPPAGLRTHVERTGMIPTIDPGTFVAAIRSGALPVRPGVERLDGDHVVFDDGSSMAADAVVAATGYRPGLEALVGHLGVLREDGWPSANGAASPAGAPGLHFIGFSRPISGNLRELRLDGRRIARAITARSAHRARRCAGSRRASG